MIRYIAFDLDDTLFNGTLLSEKSRIAAIEMMLSYGLPVEKEYLSNLLYEIIEEFGSNNESHLDNLMIRLQHDPNHHLSTNFNVNKFVAAGIMGYHREKVKHFKPFRDVIKTLEKLREKNIKTAIITDGNPKKQYEKILRLKLENLFDEILISDEVAVRKPNPEIFKFFLDKVNCKPDEVIYIGDRLDKDIDPANKIGIVTVLIHRGTKHDPYVTKEKSLVKPNFHANNLYELFNIIEKHNIEDE